MRIDVQPRRVDGQEGVPITFTVEIYNTSSIIGAYSVRVLGVEMVHVPGGPFQVGEGSDEVEEERQPNSFYTLAERGGAATPYRIASEDAIVVERRRGASARSAVESGRRSRRPKDPGHWRQGR